MEEYQAIDGVTDRRLVLRACLYENGDNFQCMCRFGNFAHYSRTR